MNRHGNGIFDSGQGLRWVFPDFLLFIQERKKNQCTLQSNEETLFKELEQVRIYSKRAADLRGPRLLFEDSYGIQESRGQLLTGIVRVVLLDCVI